MKSPQVTMCLVKNAIRPLIRDIDTPAHRPAVYIRVFDDQPQELVALRQELWTLNKEPEIKRALLRLIMDHAPSAGREKMKDADGIHRKNTVYIFPRFVKVPKGAEWDNGTDSYRWRDQEGAHIVWGSNIVVVTRGMWDELLFIERDMGWVGSDNFLEKEIFSLLHRPQNTAEGKYGSDGYLGKYRARRDVRSKNLSQSEFGNAQPLVQMTSQPG